jgi:hypothetical protein
MKNETGIDMRYSVILVFLLISASLFAQEKVEEERRIKKSEVPANARKWLRDAYEGKKKVRWYYEETSGEQSYEAKLKWKGHLHSVEFNTEGIIEDIEVKLQEADLPETVRRNLEHYFETTYTSHTILKVQRQWIGSSEDLEDAIDENEVEDVETRYEIEFYGRAGSEKEIWEGLFDAQGQMIRKRIIELKPTDNLRF